MTIYKGIYTGTKHAYFEYGESYEIVLSDIPNKIEMKFRGALYYKTTHNNIENLLNTWAFLMPLKINNNKL